MRLVLLTLILLFAGCNSDVFDATPKKLSYHVFVEPELSRIRISGTIEHLKKGTYYFALPRTQGFPSEHFVKYVTFNDASGELAYEMTDLGEWKVHTAGETLTFTYHINLQQSLKYQSEAWGGATTYMDESEAFINGSLSFMVPLIKNISSPVDLSWEAPEDWNVVTPWTATVNTMQIPSHYSLVNNYYVVYRGGSMIRQNIQQLELNTVWLGDDDINAYPEAARSIRRVVEAGLELFGEDASKEGITLILRDSNAQNRFRASTEANSIEFNFKRGMTFDRVWSNYQEGFLRLLAHEIMHTWDRREVEEASAYLHIREWGPNTCWLREGFTEYFAMLNLYNAGMRDLSTFVNTMQAIAEASYNSNTEGRYTLTDACASFFNDDEALNFIYTGGATLAFKLDLKLRRASGGDKNLPELMRIYMDAYRYKEKTIESFIKTWEVYAPANLHDIGESLMRQGTINFEPELKELGLGKTPSSNAKVFYWLVPDNSTFKQFF